ncbi:alcohol dehydrogenase catalytic domain-containing protein [Paenibacillus validus]|nr:MULTISPECIES: alcohol dehydrogenase catalytic domain-containing protein [Paenibacillus]MED4600501.1 alcohol dehydrogenase catalytic domain-containing protein [Paenibacillus validus]MED4604760.1 alcohol dehydrogenase catalytic domain-containing protein [Paenibacillus validus]
MATMKAGLFLGAKNVQVGELEKPSPKQGEALIKVAYAGICGTDMMIYAGRHPRAKAPLAMGHEFCGEIVEIAGDSAFVPGERVVIEPTLSCGTCEACLAGQTHVCKTLRLIGIDGHGGFAEYVVVPLNRLHRIPESLSDAHAALTEPLAVAVHSVRRSNMKVGDRVVILGGGPIGLMIGMVAKLAGAREIIVSDISPYRLSKAKELGFVALDAKTANVGEEIRTITQGVGADIVFEVAGTPATVSLMVEAVRIQGQVVVVSLFKQPPAVDLASMHFKEISLTTTRCYSTGDFETAIQFMAKGMLDISPMISHELKLDQVAQGFEYMENPDQSLKVLIQP